MKKNYLRSHIAFLSVLQNHLALKEKTKIFKIWKVTSQAWTLNDVVCWNAIISLSEGLKETGPQWLGKNTWWGLLTEFCSSRVLIGLRCNTRLQFDEVGLQFWFLRKMNIILSFFDRDSKHCQHSCWKSVEYSQIHDQMVKVIQKIVGGGNACKLAHYSWLQVHDKLHFLMLFQTSFKILKWFDVIYYWNNNTSIIRDVYFAKLKGLKSTATAQNLCYFIWQSICRFVTCTAVSNRVISVASVGSFALEDDMKFAIALQKHSTL